MLPSLLIMETSGSRWGHVVVNQVDLFDGHIPIWELILTRLNRSRSERLDECRRKYGRIA